jgi:sugar lactone lactonase YvrE
VKGDETTLPDITAKHLYEDQLGRMWVATYKNGVAMSADAMSNFSSIELGDINAITEDHDGHYWLGLNSGGILKVDPETMEVEESFNKQGIGVLNDVVVGSYTAKDGTLWFGTWEGGLIRYRNGQWKNYTAAMPGSAFQTNNIWGITEDYWGNIWVGVLGGGVVRIDKRTERQRSWTTKNSTIKTDWTNSITRAANGWILLGNSEYCSLVNPVTMKLINMPLPHDEKSYTISAATTQALMDARGLIWQGSASGVNVFDRKTGQSTLLDMKSGFYGNSVVALTEDERGTIWVVTDHGVSNITPKQENGVWTFAVRSYNDRDGLQPGPFNQRAVYYSKKGLLLVGGQDGLDIINTTKLANNSKEEKPVFSGLVIYNDLIESGHEYEGHVILEKALFDCKELYLRSDENHFSIQMASNDGGVKNGTRFIYRLEGYDDTWVKTEQVNPNISYMGLPSGSYTLCVRMFKDDGTMGEYENRLVITIGTPWYRSWWAWIIYLLLAAGMIALIRNKKRKV